MVANTGPHTNVYTFIHTPQVHTNVCTYIHTYIHESLVANTGTHIHTYIYMHTYIQGDWARMVLVYVKILNGPTVPFA